MKTQEQLCLSAPSPKPVGGISQWWRSCGVAWISRGGVDSVGLAVELTVGSHDGGADGVGLAVELGGGADGVIWLFWMIFGWF
uniref:Uncharacterized protein n=1 Tax=Fagus sylvatica TaxID=28930 RepID=A0A2N9HHC8_FAGSY